MKKKLKIFHVPAGDIGELIETSTKASFVEVDMEERTHLSQGALSLAWVLAH